MKKGFWVLLLVIGFVSQGMSQDRIREYTANKTSTPPTIDGEYTEEEWAGSEFVGGFSGLRNGAVSEGFQGVQTDAEWQWRALWDDDYLYILIEAALLHLPVNGVLLDGSFVDPLLADDTGYSGWGTGTNVDMEVFLEPNWQAGDEFNSNPPDFTENYNEEGAANTYQFVFFPLADELDTDGSVFQEGNFGIRNTTEGPPFAHSGFQSTPTASDWAPFYDPAEAEAAGVMPMTFAGMPHEVEGAGEGEIVARPVLEVAFPFSQFTPAALPDIIDELDLSVLSENLLLTQGDDGTWVSPGDEWLINITGYTDPVMAETGLTLITWNDSLGGGFNTYPRAILRFAEEGTNVQDWSVYE